jgi:hypothetical protein
VNHGQLGTQAQQWNGLALHVRSHQSAIRIIMLKERNQPSGHRYQLLRRHVHKIYIGWFNINEVTFTPTHDSLVKKVSFVVNRRVGLSNNKLFFSIGC